MPSVPAYSISASAVAAEKARAGGDAAKMDVSRVLALDSVELRPLGASDVHVRILAVSAEHNIDHASTADTGNPAETRGGKIYPGNSATAEVLAVGANVTRFAPGDVVITHCNGGPDPYGFPTRIWAYDADGSIGWYAKEAVVGEWQLIKAPLDCGLSLWEIAALPLRAPTAYHLWRRALGIYRLKVPYERRALVNVLGFGGGVSELFLQLAHAEGHRTFFCSGSPERRAALEKQGITGIDQKQFNRFKGKDDVKAFTAHCRKLTGGEQMHLVCDMLRGPVFAAGLAVSARQGVNVSAGWQLSQVVEYNSTLMSVKQVTIDHTHYETVEGCAAATALYGRVFKPTVHKEIYAWKDLPRAHQEMHENTQTGIPIVRVADELPESVKGLA
ncbi:MAG TPA: zinc-binding dehydrogenase [Myxococcota bacterium]|nr:zinc-binding dehydrogenase [Myxococcota bacterium]